MTSIATLLSYPINQRSRGTAHATFFFALTKVERIISYHHFEVQSPLLSSPCCLSRVSLSSADNTIVAWLWPDGEGTTTTGAFSVEKKQNEDSLDLNFDGIDFGCIVFIIYFFVFFVYFCERLWPTLATKPDTDTWYKRALEKKTNFRWLVIFCRNI